MVIGAAILFALYGLVVIFLVVRGSRKTKDIKDYAVGSITFSPVFVGLSLAAATTSAATFVINPGFVASYGVSALLSYGVFFPLATLASIWILTKSFRKFGASVNATSLASWIGGRYKSPGYSLFIALLSILLITFIVLILVALAQVMSAALAVNSVWVLAVLTAFTFGYMMFGGANSMVYTNAIQAIIMVVVAVILIFSGVRFFNDGITGVLERLGAIDPALTKGTNPASPLFHDWWEIIVAQIIVGIAVVCQPHIITKSLLLKRERDVNKYLVTGLIVQGLFFAVVIAGLYARLFFAGEGVAMPANDQVIPQYVVLMFSGGIASVLVGLLVMLGLTSAGFSTVEGLIQSLGTTVTMDIVKPLFGKRIKNDRSYITINRCVIAATGIIAFVLARGQLLHPNVSVAIFAQNGVYAYFSVAFVPILFGIFIKSFGKRAALTGSIVAAAVYFTVYYLLPYLVNSCGVDFGYVNIYLQGHTHNPAIAASTAIIASVVVALAVHFVNSKQLKIDSK